MKFGGIRARILVIALLPALIIALVLGVWYLMADWQVIHLVDLNSRGGNPGWGWAIGLSSLCLLLGALAARKIGGQIARPVTQLARAVERYR